MVTPPAIEIDDAIVLLLGAEVPGDRTPGTLRGITRLEKLIFLLERETSAKDWLAEQGDFVAYNFGPFSAKVYKAVDTLAAAQIILDSSRPSETDEDTWEENYIIGDPLPAADPYATRDFALTNRGHRYYNVLTAGLSRDKLAELAQFKERFANLPLRQLVRYVYMRYESFTEKSLIRDDILRFGS